jgi:hypothetical protein
MPEIQTRRDAQLTAIAYLEASVWRAQDAGPTTSTHDDDVVALFRDTSWSPERLLDLMTTLGVAFVLSARATDMDEAGRVLELMRGETLSGHDHQA